jgi:ribosome biogenesis GTPase
VACFREFAEFEDGCKFCPCNHTHEPACGVKEAVASGEVAQSRYQSYLDILQEIKEIKEKEGKRLW